MSDKKSADLEAENKRLKDRIMNLEEEKRRLEEKVHGKSIARSMERKMNES